jgi:hypothetical protein
MAWAKLYTDILGDPKLMRAARKGLKGIEFLPWLIAFAKEANDDGRLSVGGEPAEPADFAELIPCATRKNITDCLKSLEKIGVLSRETEGNASKSDSFLRFSAWERRSGVKPSDSPSAISERVQRHRERAKNAQPQSLPAVTPEPPAAQEGDGNALQGVSCNATEEKRVRVRREEIQTQSVSSASALCVLAWSVYPKRAGSNPRRAAERAWSARVREGVQEADMFAGTERYRTYCEGRSIVGSDFVMQAQRFYGPNHEYENGWETSEGAGKPDTLEARVAQMQRDEAERAAADELWLSQRSQVAS